MTPSDLGARASAELANTRFGDVRWVQETASTNADALDAARSGGPEGIVFVAEHQTAGRGRHGRSWQAPPGASLLCTVLLRPAVEAAGASTMAVALSAAEAVEELMGVAPGLKWPNDLVWPGDGGGNDRKLAGILAESFWPAGANSAAVAVGIGLNVAWGRDVPSDLGDIAIALDHIGSPPERLDLLVAMLRRLEHRCSQMATSEGRDVLRQHWASRSATIGRRVRVDLGSDELIGVASGVTAEGHLIVQTDAGDSHTVSVGDVVHLRAHD